MVILLAHRVFAIFAFGRIITLFNVQENIMCPYLFACKILTWLSCTIPALQQYCRQQKTKTNLQQDSTVSINIRPWVLYLANAAKDIRHNSVQIRDKLE